MKRIRAAVLMMVVAMVCACGDASEGGDADFPRSTTVTVDGEELSGIDLTTTSCERADGGATLRIGDSGISLGHVYVFVYSDVGLRAAVRIPVDGVRYEADSMSQTRGSVTLQRSGEWYRATGQVVKGSASTVTRDVPKTFEVIARCVA
jgi:hypothetical protein